MNDELSELCIRALHGGVAEIRELRELNTELLEALKDVLKHGITRPEEFQKAAALISKAEAMK